MPAFDAAWTPAERAAVSTVKALVDADPRGTDNIVLNRDMYELVESAFGKVWIQKDTGEWFLGNERFTPTDMRGLKFKNRVIVAGV